MWSRIFVAAKCNKIDPFENVHEHPCTGIYKILPLMFLSNLAAFLAKQHL